MRRPLLWLLLGLMAGELVVSWLGIAVVPATSLDTAMEGRDSAFVCVSGTVRQISRTKSGFSYRLSDNTVSLGDEILATHDLLVYTDERENLEIGQTVSVTGTLSPFERADNPGQFDSDGYYRALGIDFLIREEERTLLLPGRAPLRRALDRLRSLLSEKLERMAGEDAGLLLSLFLGDRSELSSQTRAWYELGGISHILAISGLHVSLFGMALYHFLRRCLLPPAVCGAVGGFIAGCYVVMTGAGTSSLRALVMFGFFLAAQALGRTYDLLSALSAAGLLLLWEHPLLLGQEGFQLSFLAMAGVGVVCPTLEGWLGKGGALRQSLLFSLSIQLATLPALAWHEGTWAAYGIFLNLLVIPLTGPLLGLTAAGSALACLWERGAVFLLAPARAILRLYEGLCRLAARLPGHTWILGQPARWQIALYALLLSTGLLWLSRRTKRHREREEKGAPPVRIPVRLAPVLLLAGALFLTLQSLPFRGLQVTFLDVGQGDCIFVRTQGGCCLIDGGSSSVSEVGINRIVPYLKNQGIRRLDAVFVTHGDSDHMNGLEAVLRDESLSVTELCITPASAGDDTLEELMAAAAEEEVPVRVISAGVSWTWGDTRFLCEYPDEDDCAALAGDENETSLVLSLREEDFSVLLPGDLGEEGEKRWRENGESGRDYTILKAGHHGSRNSSSEAFLEAVSPRITVISCGKNNRYGHPHEETLERLREAGSLIYTTPACGAITVIRRDGEVRSFAFRP